jgi:hypothetical protein
MFLVQIFLRYRHHEGRNRRFALRDSYPRILRFQPGSYSKFDQLPGFFVFSGKGNDVVSSSTVRLS